MNFPYISREVDRRLWALIVEDGRSDHSTWEGNND